MQIAKTEAEVMPTSIVSPYGIASSLDIAELAFALARAQAVMENPEKDREAKIESRSSDKSYGYKYVDFGTALAVIRPALAAQDLSFVQMPVLDGAAMNVVTRLMHKSGQWIESAYPVSDVGEHRTMGGALTYARRYSLFAVLGIAGEEDLDAEPDATAKPTGRGRKAATPQVKGTVAGQQRQLEPPAVVSLSAEESARASGAMIDSLKKCVTREDELAWATANSGVKASLAPEDAKAVTTAFTQQQRARREAETKDKPAQ